MDSVSTRDWFAGLAMQEMLRRVSEPRDAHYMVQLCEENKITPSEQIAKMAYEQADVMLRWSATHEFKP